MMNRHCSSTPWHALSPVYANSMSEFFAHQPAPHCGVQPHVSGSGQLTSVVGTVNGTSIFAKRVEIESRDNDGGDDDPEQLRDR